VHASEFEGRPARRPLTAEELQRFFDYADAQVDRVAESGRKGTLGAAAALGRPSLTPSGRARGG